MMEPKTVFPQFNAFNLVKRKKANVTELYYCHKKGIYCEYMKLNEDKIAHICSLDKCILEDNDGK